MGWVLYIRKKRGDFGIRSLKFLNEILFGKLGRKDRESERSEEIQLCIDCSELNEEPTWSCADACR